MKHKITEIVYVCSVKAGPRPWTSVDLCQFHEAMWGKS